MRLTLLPALALPCLAAPGRSQPRRAPPRLAALVFPPGDSLFPSRNPL